MAWRSVLFVGLLAQLGLSPLQAEEPPPSRRMCVVLGAPGESKYGEAFQTWGDRWRQSASDFDFNMIDGTDDTLADASEVKGVKAHRDAIFEWIAAADTQTREHWLILIGHGTHDSKATRFNLKGPDLSAVDLGKALDGKPGKWIIVFCSSASAPFLAGVSGANRVVITATKSGSEENYSRFGDFLSQSLSDSQVDMDHDQSVSVLELFLAASRRIEKYYSDQGLLATEQALIDDNGDGRGTPAVFYRGVRAVKAPAEGATLDGENARRVMLSRLKTSVSREIEDRIAEIESKIEGLRRKKADMVEDLYYDELEKLLLQLAEYLQVDQKPR